MNRTTMPLAFTIGTALLLAACSQDPEPAPALPPVAAPATTTPAATATTAGTDAAAGTPATGSAVPTTPSGDIQAYTTSLGGNQTVTFQVAQSPELGGYVVDGEGFTLYRFNPDTPKPSRSTCNEGCAVAWPPVLATHKVQYVGLQRKNIDSLHREDGSVQMSIGKWPVYRFAKDTAPGQINGQGVDGNWFAVAPDGSRAGDK
jgi:predicted lipoprotein with Yx(FWY)xxD motif